MTYIQSNIILFILIPLLLSHCKDVKNNDDNFKDQSVIEIKLPHQLNEISGICFTDDGKLFGHNDEKGVVYQIDTKTGKIIKAFQLGKIGVEADFEDIAIIKDNFFLISSKGVLYEFNEGKNLQKVDFKVIDLGFSSKFEIEGLCYDKNSKSLLIASKEYPGKHYKGYRAVYSYSLRKKKTDKTPRFLIPLKELKKEFDIKDFYPSAITQNPYNGNFYILSAKGRPAIIEIDSNGKLIDGKKLSSKKHRQPEGIAVSKDLKIFISDEGAGKSAKITVYKKMIKTE